MKIEETACDYCTRREGPFSALRIPLRPDMDREHVCKSCQDRIAEFIQGSLMDRTGLREMARRRKSLLSPDPRSAPGCRQDMD